jgi:hypothetical protein
MAQAGDENRLPPALGGFLTQQIELICEQLDEYCLLDADNHLSLGREHLIQAITIAAAPTSIWTGPGKSTGIHTPEAETGDQQQPRCR